METQPLYTRKIFNMEEMQKMKDSPIWNQGKTQGLYRYPLPLGIDFSEAGKRLSLGVPDDECYMLGPYHAARSPESHVSPYKWAVDFLIPDGTEVLAAQDGIIVEVVDNFNEWGDSGEFRDKLNYLTIQHSNGELSQYCHLALNSFHDTGLVKGDHVTKGQVIGLVGKTGWTDRDHLHFIVFKVGDFSAMGNPFKFFSYEIRFEEPTTGFWSRIMTFFGK